MEDRATAAKTDKVCAVVVTYNRKTLLEECLRALQAQTRPLDEIIVIDNASSDGTENFVKTQFDGITYMKLAENVGGAGGFHEGMKLAYEKGHDWIWVMDDDAIPMPDALERLTICPAIMHEDVYALASTVLREDRSIFLIHRRTFNAENLEQKAVTADKYNLDYFEIDTASFVALLISQRAIKDVGLPLKDLFIYYDDTEYSLRIRQKGTIVTVSNSKVIHPQAWGDSGGAAQRQQPLDWRVYYSLRNQIYMLRKYGRPSLSTTIVYYRRLFVTTALGIAGTLLFRQSKVRSIKTLVYGMLDGLRAKLGRNIDFIPE